MGGEHVWQGVCMAGGHVCQGVCMAGGHAWQERRPLQQTVRILLECILVPYVTERYFPSVSKFFPVTAKFPVFFLSGKSKNQILCFPVFPMPWPRCTVLKSAHVIFMWFSAKRIVK